MDIWHRDAAKADIQVFRPLDLHRHFDGSRLGLLQVGQPRPVLKEAYGTTERVFPGQRGLSDIGPAVPYACCGMVYCHRKDVVMDTGPDPSVADRKDEGTGCGCIPVFSLLPPAVRFPLPEA